MKNISIYIVAHKEAKFPKKEGYKPIQVGGKEKFTNIRDNTGDNIAVKNPNFCELTAAYWIWKNDKTSNIVGLTHYRRYFFKSMFTNQVEKVLEKEEIENILKDYDIIVPKKTRCLKYTVREAYEKKHKVKDFDECRKIIEEKYPDYIEAFDYVANHKNVYLCNIFISNKKIFDEYYKWLFDILFTLEERTDISNYSDYDKRIYGFLSERLFNVWLKKNSQLKIKPINVYNTDENFLKQLVTNAVLKVLVRKQA